MIPFNIPPFLGKEIEYIKQAVERRKISGDGIFTARSSRLIEQITNSRKALLTTSCTHALEMAAILTEIGAGDEIIMPSYTFVSTANAFVLRGAKIVFVDIRPDTMNINEDIIESAVTQKTRAIVPVHYAGVSCEMDKIMYVAKKYNLFVIEDAAQAIGAEFDGGACGTFGDFGCISFHETKNVSMGEGGALLVNDARKVEIAEIIREKGTNRSKFFRGQVDKYTWVDTGSSYLPSELNAAYLTAQLENIEEINGKRLWIWKRYYEELKFLEEKGCLSLPIILDRRRYNGHLFYIKVRDLNERTRFLKYLKTNGVGAVFHYIPLHSAPAGLRFGRFHGDDVYTTRESERLIRLPLYYGMTGNDIDYAVRIVKGFFQ